jgi:hypothetical protein
MTMVVGSGTTGPVEIRTSQGIATSSTTFTHTGGEAFARVPNKATLVLGQLDFTSGNAGTTSASMDFVESIAVDPTTGKVFVAERDNSRVLRFASYASLSNGAAAEAVLGRW